MHDHPPATLESSPAGESLEEILLPLPPLPDLQGIKLNALTSGRSEFFKLDPRIIRPEPGWNERTTFLGIPALALSMLENGQTDAITVRRDPEGHILIVTGERRWRAAIHIITHHDPAWLISAKSEPPHTTLRNRLFRLLEENSGHEFGLLEKARIYQRLIAADDSLTEAEIARRAQTSRQSVNQALTIIRFASPALLDLITTKKISATAAGEIIRQHKQDHAAQDSLATAALDHALTRGRSNATPKDFSPAEHSATPTTTTVKSLAPADPSAHQRLVDAPSTHRDGSSASSGPGSGFAPPDKRLAALDTILDDLAENHDYHEPRFETAEIIRDFLHNERSAKDIKAHLLGKV